jgi:hypothetical protein
MSDAPCPLKPEDSYITREQMTPNSYHSDAKNLFPFDDEKDVLLNDEELKITHAGIGIRLLHVLCNLEQIDQGQEIREWEGLPLRENREDRAKAMAIVEALDLALKGKDEPATIVQEFEMLTFEEKLAEMHKQYDELRAPAYALLQADKRARETAEVARKL